MLLCVCHKERTLTIWINLAPSHHIVLDTMSQEKNILLLILLIYFRAHIYSLELHYSNECFYLMKTPFILLASSWCSWYMRTKRQSPSNIFLTILIYFLAQLSLFIHRIFLNCTKAFHNMWFKTWLQKLILTKLQFKMIGKLFLKQPISHSKDALSWSI